MNAETVKEILSPEESRMINDFAVCVFDKAKEIVVNDKDTFEQTAIRLQIVKTKFKEIEERRKELVKPFQEATKKLNDFFKRPLDLLKGAENCLKSAMSSYAYRLEQEQKEKQRKIDEIAEREREKIKKRAEKQLQKGNEKKAEELIQQVELVPHAVVESEVPNIKGISTRENWKYRVVDLNKVPREFLVLDDARLSKIAKATKGLVPIEGIEFYSEAVIVSQGIH